MLEIVARESTGSTLTYIMVPIEGYATHRKIYILYAQEVVTPFYVVSYYIIWGTTSWTYSMYTTGCSPRSILGMSFIFLFNQEANHCITLLCNTDQYKCAHRTRTTSHDITKT